ncbi:MAG TPA: hypothetical protein VG944_21325 [Fimbriimonas sp.]|nr:hypothetical protein [Fimbriimonas sp.]
MTDPLDAITAEQFKRFRNVRRGTQNPEPMNNPFWEAMIRSGGFGWTACEHFGVDPQTKDRPVWSFNRHGMSRTILDDDSLLFIAGEHEDSYDPHFAIYNDVIIRRPNGDLEIYGYSPRDFPPTDFHTATKIDDYVWIIGSLGYDKDRIAGTTPIFQLNLRTFRIQEINVHGEEPSWLSRHSALHCPEQDSIVVWGARPWTCSESSPATRTCGPSPCRS